MSYQVLSWPIVSLCLNRSLHFQVIVAYFVLTQKRPRSTISDHHHRFGLKISPPIAACVDEEPRPSRTVEDLSIPISRFDLREWHCCTGSPFN